MKSAAIGNILRAYRCPYTYDPIHNPHVVFGFLWGLPIPVFSLLLDLWFLGSEGRTVSSVFREHPIHLVFLVHPLLFAVFFGALGTARRDAQRRRDRQLETLQELAMTDPLTELNNRRYLMEEFSHKGLFT
ncbi:MAG: hypothetical protein HY716_14145 [Planctomycetes bacterium]|nr:hypothetical protein [Planctomycetota bacterium]